MIKEQINNYYTQPVKEVLNTLNVKTTGLTDEEAASRLCSVGPNVLPDVKKFSVVNLFIHQFKNPLIYILFIALIISFVSHHIVDAWIIVVVILISSVVGFMQEFKANHALSKLKRMVKHKTMVLREGKRVVIGQENVVPGDIIYLSPGDQIPADARLIEVQNFEVIEAALTGESTPSKKSANILPEGTPLADRENMVYLGTVVARGKAKAIIVATGKQTELGTVATLIRETMDTKTPLQKQLSTFGKVIAISIVGLNIIIFGLGILTGKPLFEMFLTSVAVVVAAVPEGLLPAMTVILAIGMQSLVKHKGLVRKMLAAETLGSVSVICADKTGTLTQGEMRVVGIITDKTDLSYSDMAYSQEYQKIDKKNHFNALKIGLLCNNAMVEDKKKELNDWEIVGDPTEKALFLAGHIAGYNKEELEKEEPRIAEIPFDSEYKFMATFHKREKGFAVYIKGAPERILQLSTFFEREGKRIVLTEEKRLVIRKQIEYLTGQGMRVLAVGYKSEDRILSSEEFTRENLRDLVFVGLIALKDPLRIEAKKTITLCQRAGIRPVIITGDHKLTTMAIVRELGIEIDNKHVLEGADLDGLSDEELRGVVEKIVIFARVEPKHKLRIVSAFQENGKVVAMTGDGINDAPALKKADIGVAVASGTDVAKETADLVLLDNNFKTIVEAVKRGRITFNNIRKVVLYLLTDSFSEMVIVGGSVIFGFPLPILPAQILWIKLIEDAAPAMSLSFDEIEKDIMNESPRKRTEPILNRRYKVLIAFYSLVMDLSLFGLFYYFWKTSGNLDYARTITFVGLGLSSLFYVYAVRGLKLSVFRINPFSNKFLTTTTIIGALLFVVAIYIPFFNRILHTVPLGLKEWLILGTYAIMSIFVYEGGKKLINIRRNV